MTTTMPDNVSHGTVLYVTNIPTPYRLPLYRAMARQLAEQGLALHVLFLGKHGRKREWKIDEAELTGFSYSAITNYSGSFTAEVLRRVREAAPVVVILGWSMGILALRLLLQCRKRGIPCLIVNGETDRTAPYHSYAFLRKFFRILFFKFADGFVTYGTRSMEYLLGRGVPSDRVFKGMNVVDAEFFAREVDSVRDTENVNEERRKYELQHISDTCHLLFVGYLVERKGGLQMLEALRVLDRKDIVLHIVGSGAQQEELRRRVQELGLAETVHFHGYRQTHELPYYFALADVLLFPSLVEIFGLVLVEGAAAGLPVIASRFAGGTVDVVKDGTTGIAVDPANVQEFANAITMLANNSELRKSMGNEGRKYALQYLTPDKSAAHYLQAINTVLRKK